MILPNHVRNVLKFSKLKPTEIDFILERFSTKEENGERMFDLDMVIPEPRLEADCPEDCKVNKDSHVQTDEKRPWFDWYTWHNKYWGTKWNAYDGYVKIGKTWVMFVFSTAWCTPYPVYEQLAKKYNFRFEVRYADEDYGSNCGILTCEPDGMTGKMTLYHDDATDYYKDPREFAMRIWNTY